MIPVSILIIGIIHVVLAVGMFLFQHRPPVAAIAMTYASFGFLLIMIVQRGLL